MGLIGCSCGLDDGAVTDVAAVGVVLVLEARTEDTVEVDVEEALSEPEIDSIVIWSVPISDKVDVNRTWASDGLLPAPSWPLSSCHIVLG